MSEYRHFQYQNGAVESTKDRLRIDDLGTSTYVRGEVQVAPLNAEVVTDLPKVEAHPRTPDLLLVDGTPVAPDIYSPEDFERRAKTHLAIARYLREHPPTDPEVERQVDAVRKAWADEMGIGMSDDFARRLVARGVRVEPQP
jgi:hypothetical protein